MGQDERAFVGLITRRSQVQILPPPLSITAGPRPFPGNREGPFFCPNFSTVPPKVIGVEAHRQHQPRRMRRAPRFLRQ